MISIRHREELHLIAVVIPTWVYAILWRSSFVYTSALICKSCNHNLHGTHDYQSHSARSYKQRKTPTSEHSGVITLRTLILAPPRGDDIYISFSRYTQLPRTKHITQTKVYQPKNNSRDGTHLRAFSILAIDYKVTRPSITRGNYFEASTDTLRNSLRSFVSSKAALRARVPAALLFFSTCKFAFSANAAY